MVSPHAVMPPELWSNQPYTFSSDLWALGCCLYELMTYRSAIGNFHHNNHLGSPELSHFCILFTNLNGWGTATRAISSI